MGMKVAATISALSALLLVACSRQPKQGPPGPPSSAPATSTAESAASVNPFARTYPFATATITYAKKDGNFEEVIQIKGGKRRSQTTKGLLASDTWSLTDEQAEYRVLPKERKVIVFRADTQHHARIQGIRESRIAQGER